MKVPKYDTGDILDYVISHHHFASILDNEIFDPVLFDRLFIAGMLVLGGVALVIPMYCSVSPCAALAGHISTAFTAEQLGGQ